MRLLNSLLTALFFIAGIFFITLNQPDSHTNPNKVKKISHGRSGALEALDFWTRARAYPNTDIPADKYFRAYETSKSKTREVSNLLSAGSIWDPIGPLNLQGRTKSVAINPLDPNTVYVGTASGGLWRSRTGGLGGDWQQVKLGYPALGISAIAINPVDTNIMYLGTGEVYNYSKAVGGLVLRTTRGSYGIGILKTTDGGSTWTKSLDWTYDQQQGVQMIRLNPLNPNTIWAATTEGIYKSSDAGASWENLFGLQMANDLVIHLTDTNSIMVTGGNFTPSYVLVTTDGGSEWNISPMPTYTGKILLAIYPLHPNVVYASAADSTTGVGGFFRTTNFGTTWTKLRNYSANNSFMGVQGWYSHYVAVYPTDSSIIIHNAVGRSKSTNGGQYFYTVSTGYSDNHGYAIHPTNPDIVYAVNDDGVYRSTDFGDSYTNIGFGLQTGQVYNGFSCSTSDSLVALLQTQDHIPGYLYLGSNIWLSSANDEAGWTAIDPTNDNNMYAINRFGGYILKSTDRGSSFNYKWNFTGTGAWNSPVVISPSDANTIYFADTKVYKSTDGAEYWSLMNSGANLDNNPALSLAMSATNSDTVYVGTAPIATLAHIFRTVNGGTSWTNITGSLPNRYPIDLAVDPTNSRVVYAAFGGFGSGHLFRTSDAGATWADISGPLPDAPATAVVVDPLHPEVIYAGNDLGVYVSTNSGTTWASFSSGLPDAVIVADLAISPSNRTLRVATHGNGVWERKMLYELPSNFFDYKALSVNSPMSGSQYLLTSDIPMSATFRNLSVAAQPDSFDVKMRILSGSTELYSVTKRIAGLAVAENRLVDFGHGFIPSSDGNFTAQVISLASDFNPSNDTTQISFVVALPSNVSNWTSSKVHSIYSEIVGGDVGPSGDDSQTRIGLPFTFVYDNKSYDSIQISTNGWAELGSGIPGDLIGLSTTSQLGGYFTTTLATTGHPTKALGPWWTDLSADYGAITYTSTGISPDRIFTIQWKNIPAYCCDAATTITLNFQIKLHETTNLIEFCYGPKSAGTLAGYTGASIGLKDYVGGDYRFFDVYSHQTGTTGQLRSDLTPVANWPGADSAYLITTNTMGIAAAHDAGWNLVSVPMTRSDNSATAVFPTANAGTLFRYVAQYQSVDSLVPGAGYWIKFASSGSQFIAGSSLSSVTVPVNTGWNIIGSVDHDIPAPSGGIIMSSVFGYTPQSGYTADTTLTPGKGYWVKTNTAGSLTLGLVAQQKVIAPASDAQCSITITDKRGYAQKLFVSESDIDPSLFELPPLPPAEMFDARFASHRMLEVCPSTSKNELIFPILMQSPVYPLTVSFKSSPSAQRTYELAELSGGKIITTHSLTGDGTFQITADENRSIRIVAQSPRAVPVRFALTQNYPNPFNPSTTISFDVPQKSMVHLTVYDILGKEIMTLADGEYEAGSYTVRGDFSNLASGIYIYRMNAGTFSDVKKMVFTK
jgi:photosystem II stability/assembly factor-like uncharacterized protein